MKGTERKNIKISTKVKVVQKQDQISGNLTDSPTHPHGIKVMLEDGIVGRVKEIL